MRHGTALLAVLTALLATACGESSTQSTVPTTDDAGVPGEDTATPTADVATEDTASEDTATVKDERIHVLFTVNTHDWVYPTKSIETLHRVIDIHEKHQVPVDIYLTDPMVQLYATEAPELMGRFKTSKVVAMSYHVRPPSPYYPKFDHAGLNALSEADLKEHLESYETQKLELATGTPISGKPGGYNYLKALIGYAPIAVGTNRSGGPVTQALYNIYKDMGAKFTVVHKKDSNPGDLSQGLYIRPEHVEVKLYEYKNGKVTGKDIMEQELAEKGCDNTPGDCPSPIYMNLKFHENNWYTNGTSWWPVYFTDSSKETALSPPFDLKASEGVIKMKPQNIQDNLWTVYEEAVAHVAGNPDTFRAVNMKDIANDFPALP